MDEEAARKLLELTGQVMMTFGRMRRFAHVNDPDSVHPGTEFALLETILRHECKTTPEIANLRGVTRQSIQKLVNKMIESGALCYVENPNHKISKYLQVTDHGRSVYKSVENEMLERYLKVNTDLRKGDVDIAARVLAVIAETWETEKAAQALTGHDLGD